jgi:hypothetical protein
MKSTSPRWLSHSLRLVLHQFDSGLIGEAGLSWALYFV